MVARSPALRLLLLVGTWAIPIPGEDPWRAEEPLLQLRGGGCRCTGMLEVKWSGRWHRVCRENLSQTAGEGICRGLGCGPPTAEPLGVTVPDGQREPRTSLGCQRPVATSEKCHWKPTNCTEHAFLACGEPVKTTPEPPPAPPTTTPEPTGPPRLELVDGEFGCSGFLGLHKEGVWGAVGGSPGVSPPLAARICRALRCGTAVHPPGYAEPQPGSRLPVRWEVVEPCEEDHGLFDCFNRSSARRGRSPAFIVCSGSPPLQRRLGGGPTPCEGDIEVFHEGRWRVLCDERGHRARRGQQLCQELRCGNLTSSTEVRDPPARGVTCEVPPLHPCSDGPQTCSRTRIVCQDSQPRPTGASAGTIASICLALLLCGLLGLLCGPPAYRGVMKRISKKKQRQWIGPTGLNQTVSFHRNSTVTPRQRPEGGQRGQGGDNDYVQPPQKSSYLSAYPALEGACRASNPPDNSSDSDYDLHSTRRL